MHVTFTFYRVLIDIPANSHLMLITSQKRFYRVLIDIPANSQGRSVYFTVTLTFLEVPFCA